MGLVLTGSKSRTLLSSQNGTRSGASAFDLSEMIVRICVIIQHNAGIPWLVMRLAYLMVDMVSEVALARA